MSTHQAIATLDHRWTYIDYRRAFPMQCEKDEINISLSHNEGGASGEFSITFHELGGKMVPRLEAFDDSWNALQLSGLIPALSEMDSTNPTKAELMSLLDGMGMEDKTGYYLDQQSGYMAAGVERTMNDLRDLVRQRVEDLRAKCPGVEITGDVTWDIAPKEDSK